MEIVIPIAIIFFSFSRTSLRRCRIRHRRRAAHKHQASQGSRLAQRVLYVLEDPVRRIAISPRLKSVSRRVPRARDFYGEHWLAEQIQPWFVRLESLGWIAASHTVASIVAVAVLTYLHIVIGEMVPKALALQRADKTALYVPLVRGLQHAILPLVVGLNAVGNKLLRLAGIERREVDRERYHTAEELQFIVQGKPGRRPAAR